jgi:hypothetical protein
MNAPRSATHRDLLLQITELHRQSKTRTAGRGQVPFKTVPMGAREPSGLPEMTGRETVGAQLQILGVDVDHHLMEHHYRLLREIGATDAAHLQQMHRGQQVLVAGVKSATQTPPIASGKRVIFVTPEDGSGLVDLAFFDERPRRVPLRAAAGPRHRRSLRPAPHRRRRDGLGPEVGADPGLGPGPGTQPGRPSPCKPNTASPRCRDDTARASGRAGRRWR